MPKMFVDAAQGVFTSEGRAEAAAALTDLGMACERLRDTPEVRAGVWVFFSEHAADAIFSGGRVASGPTITLVVNALQGGLESAARPRLIAGTTDILSRCASAGAGPVRVYVVIHEVPEADWGMYGKQVSLAAMQV